MTSPFVLLQGNDCTYKVHREDLLKFEYFRGVLRNEPSSLYLAFPRDIMRDLVGLIQHGNRWEVTPSSNLALALQYIGVDLPPALEYYLPLEDCIARLKNSSYSVETLHANDGVKISQIAQFYILKGAHHGWIKGLDEKSVCVFHAATETDYAKFFTVYRDYLVLKEEYKIPVLRVHTENKTFDFTCQAK